MVRSCLGLTLNNDRVKVAQVSDVAQGHLVLIALYWWGCGILHKEADIHTGCLNSQMSVYWYKIQHTGLTQEDFFFYKNYIATSYHFCNVYNRISTSKTCPFTYACPFTCAHKSIIPHKSTFTRAHKTIYQLTSSFICARVHSLAHTSPFTRAQVHWCLHISLCSSFSVFSHLTFSSFLVL